MAKTIQQKVTFKANAAKLYSLYADSKLHSAVTGQKAQSRHRSGGYSRRRAIGWPKSGPHRASRSSQLEVID